MDLQSANQNLKLILLAITIILWLYWLWTRRHFYQFALRFPGYWGLPIIGSIYKVMSIEDVLPAFKYFFDKDKLNTLLVWMGTYPIVGTQDPEFIRKVLTSTDLLNKPKVYNKTLYNFFDGGILTSPAEKWSHNRQLINPAFNHNVLVKFFPIFNKAKNLALRKFDAFVGQGEQKLLDMLHRITLGISVETTMGKQMNDGDEVDVELIKKWQYAFKQSMTQIMFSVLHLDNILYFATRKYWETRQYLRNHTNELLRHKMNSIAIKDKAREARTIKQNEDSNNVHIKKTSSIFIEQAIKLYKKQQFTFQDMQSESNTIVAGSFETTASTILAALVMLAMHPDVQEKLYEEILSVFPEKVFQMDFEHLEHLPYLDMVINEVLRLNPPIPVIGRHVDKDTQLAEDILLPKDVQIVISIFHLHRRIDIWGPNAEQFNPDNFLPENFQDIHPYAYIPFSKGPRNCIGWRYAGFALKVLIAGLVRNFRLTTSFKYKDLKYVDKITLAFAKEPTLEIYRR